MTTAWADTFLEAAAVLDVDLPRAATATPRPTPVLAEAPYRPVPVGKLAYGQGVLRLPCAGYQGDHLLVSAVTGAGKSGLLQAYNAMLARRPFLSLWFSDPKLVELGPPWVHEPGRPGRATIVANGPDEATRLLELAIAEIRHRFRWMRDHRLRVLPAGDPAFIDERTEQPWAWVVCEFDELQEVTDSDDAGNGQRRKILRSGLALGRACGVGFVLCTQDTSFATVPKRITRNCGCHVLLRTADATHDRMTTGGVDYGARRLHRKGELKAAYGGEVFHGRAAWVPDVDLYRINDETAHLRVEYPDVPAFIDIAI